jgi:hypothetical protein
MKVICVSHTLRLAPTLQRLGRMAPHRIAYHVVPDPAGDQWLVTQEDNPRFRDRYRTKAEAVAAGRARAEAHEPSRLAVHQGDGRMEFEATYGGDPRRFFG